MRSLTAIVARCILLCTYLEDIGASAEVIEANNLPAGATFRESNLAAADLPQAGQNRQTDEDELLAGIVSARISEPDLVARVLNELRIESTSHLGRLDLEEWSEMMTEMRRGGVALGSRNKLRLLVATSSTGAGTSSVGPRRAQAGSGEQESANEPVGTIFGVSGDSAPRVPTIALLRLV